MKKKTLKNSKIKSKSIRKHFFKKKEKLSQPFRFPNIIRFFTEGILFVKQSFTSTRKVVKNHSWKKLANLITIISMISVLLALLLTNFIVGLDLYRNIQQKHKLTTERQDIIYKIQYWQGIVNKYKDYRDAYFQLAILEYRLRDFIKSKSYLDKALEIDPNFEKGRELEKILSIK